MPSRGLFSRIQVQSIGRLFPFYLAMVCLLALPRISHAQAFTSLHSFTGNGRGTDGANPYSGLIQAKDGNLYGTTYQGGPNDYGTVFRITPAGVLTILYSFSGTDGAYPLGGLMQASDGNLYGTTNGFPYSDGTVFKITPGGALTTLHAFHWSDGAFPYGSLVQATDGNFYGTTYGGASDGTVYQITPGGAVTVLHNFNLTDGNHPMSSLIQARDGNLYGTTAGGGVSDAGTVFRITLKGVFTSLYSFNLTDGATPYAGLIEAKNGILYGTTCYGAVSGTVYNITTGGTFTILHKFNNTDGDNPNAGLIQAKDGNFYGTTYDGGTTWGVGSLGYGTIFRITPGGTLTTLYNFSVLSSANTNSDGAHPYAGLIQATDGNLYGTTYEGGTNGDGALYSLSVAPVVVTSLKPGSANAGGPAFALTLDGTAFASNSTVNWTQGANTTSLTIAFVSSTQLKADVPASLIAAPGNATVTVANGSANISKGKPFTILVTTLKLLSAKLTKDSAGNYSATIAVKNSGYLAAPTATITKATLGTSATSMTLPISIGSIAAGATGSTALTFPSSAGSSGASVTLMVTGTFTGGTFAGSLKVKLP